MSLKSENRSIYSVWIEQGCGFLLKTHCGYPKEGGKRDTKKTPQQNRKPNKIIYKEIIRSGPDQNPCKAMRIVLLVARSRRYCVLCNIYIIHCNTLQHTATHCNILQRTATHCNTLQHTAAHCNTLQHTAARYNTLQHTATHCNTLQHTATLQHMQYMISSCDPQDA